MKFLLTAGLARGPFAKAERADATSGNVAGGKIFIVHHPGPAIFYLVHFMIHNAVVKKVNIHDAETHLSRYLAELSADEPLVLCNRNQPVAELRSICRKANSWFPIRLTGACPVPP